MEKKLSELPASQGDLLPKKIYEIVENLDNIVVKIEHPDVNCLMVIVYERNSTKDLTDQVAWKNWQEALAMRKKYQSASDTIYHNPPPTVNRLHAKLEYKITDGTLTLADRILLTYTIRIDKSTPDVMYVDEYDGEIGVGIATEFYTTTLPSIARVIGVRYITGSNNSENIDFFVQKIGRVRLDEIKEEYQENFFPYLSSYAESVRKYLTVQFLYPKDTEKYLKQPVASAASD